jgi:hypothetical protein
MLVNSLSEIQLLDFFETNNKYCEQLKELNSGEFRQVCLSFVCAKNLDKKVN